MSTARRSPTGSTAAWQPRDLLIVAHRVAEGLVATHGRNIVHRDLSPDNIVLRGDDPAEAVIIDFGIAKDASAGARTIVGNDFAGKYEYAAPEQMHGRAEARSDLYALGASLLAVFRGRVPDMGGSPGEVLRRKEQPLDTAGVPEPLKGLIDTLTQPDPARRPPSAAATVAEIEGLLRPKPAAPPARRRRWALLAPVVLVAALAGLWASGLMDGLFPPPPASPYVLDRRAAGGGAGQPRRQRPRRRRARRDRGGLRPRRRDGAGAGGARARLRRAGRGLGGGGGGDARRGGAARGVAARALRHRGAPRRRRPRRRGARRGARGLRGGGDRGAARCPTPASPRGRSG